MRRHRAMRKKSQINKNANAKVEDEREIPTEIFRRANERIYYYVLWSSAAPPRINLKFSERQRGKQKKR